MIPSDVSAPAARGGLAPEPAARSFYTAITERSQHRHMVGELRRHMPVAYDDAGGVLLPLYRRMFHICQMAAAATYKDYFQDRRQQNYVAGVPDYSF